MIVNGELHNVWTMNDIQVAAGNVILTREQKQKALEYLDDNYNPELGICWDVVEDALDTLGFI